MPSWVTAFWQFLCDWGKTIVSASSWPTGIAKVVGFVLAVATAACPVQLAVSSVLQRYLVCFLTVLPSVATSGTGEELLGIPQASNAVPRPTPHRHIERRSPFPIVLHQTVLERAGVRVETLCSVQAQAVVPAKHERADQFHRRFRGEFFGHTDDPYNPRLVLIRWHLNGQEIGPTDLEILVCRKRKMRPGFRVQFGGQRLEFGAVRYEVLVCLPCAGDQFRGRVQVGETLGGRRKVQIVLWPVEGDKYLPKVGKLGAANGRTAPPHFWHCEAHSSGRAAYPGCVRTGRTHGIRLGAAPVHGRVHRELRPRRVSTTRRH